VIDVGHTHSKISVRAELRGCNRATIRPPSTKSRQSGTRDDPSFFDVHSDRLPSLVEKPQLGVSRIFAMVASYFVRQWRALAEQDTCHSMKWITHSQGARKIRLAEVWRVAVSTALMCSTHCRPRLQRWGKPESRADGAPGALGLSLRRGG